MLQAHGFPGPVFVEEKDSTQCAISARPRSQFEFVLALLEITPDRQITVRLQPYARVGASWPVLGEVFRKSFEQEAREMTEQMRARLKD